jgi:hypothetical protein
MIGSVKQNKKIALSAARQYLYLEKISGSWREYFS